jgi:uncharacterized membrane protein YhaH (DUF805 family)
MFQFKKLIGTAGDGLEAVSVLLIIVGSIASSVRRFHQMQKIGSSYCLGLVPLVYWTISYLVIFKKIYLTHGVTGMVLKTFCTNHNLFL